MYIKAVFTFQKTIAAWKNNFFKKYFFCIMSYMIQLYQIFIYVCQTILPGIGINRYHAETQQGLSF